ncbi:MAG: nucleotidyl transferase AbiEii/AbiGii toxin family protein [Candidatus Magasanikbacteria bacterium]|nr:nucleotidyl transferase AbiEii/AbiGii toxin family protein [Candidatus Magasanikbacteria bacterium]
MDSALKKITWCFDTLPRSTKNALDFLSAQEWLKKTDWYLAGGTALALQVGHRRSVDLDFFIKHPRFDNVDLTDRLASANHLEIELNKDNTIFAKLLGAKISFIAYPFFVPKQPALWYGFVKVLDKRDIAVMKIVAISQRGRKRDFFDLYWCANHIESLEEIIKRLPAQYPSVAHDYHHILKSMMYFEDAENDPEPVIYFSATWKQVKSFFIKEISIIARKLIK